MALTVVVAAAAAVSVSLAPHELSACVQLRPAVDGCRQLVDTPKLGKVY